MDEQELVRRAKCGDIPAFENLTKRYWTKVYHLAQSIVGEIDAEDVTVETFMQVWRKLHSFREQASFGSWLFRITLNQAKQWLRKSKTSFVSELDVSLMEDPSEANLSEIDEQLSWYDIEELACERDFHNRVKVAIQKLPEQLRLPIVLRFWNELSYPEIAKLLGINESTVRMRVVSALKTLAKELRITESKRGKIS